MNITFFSNTSISIIFAIMLACTILTAFFICFTTVPIFSLLSLVLAYIFAANSLFLLGLPYVSLVYIILYVGAVCTLFIFLVMLVELRPDAEYLKRSIRKSAIIVFLLTSFIIFVVLLLSITPVAYNVIALNETSTTFDHTLMANTVLNTVEYRDISMLTVFYTQYTRNYPMLILLAATLLIAVIGCILIAFNRPLIYSAAVRKLVTWPLLYAFFPFTKPNGDFYILSGLNVCVTCFTLSTFVVGWLIYQVFTKYVMKYRKIQEEHPFRRDDQEIKNNRLLAFWLTCCYILIFIFIFILVYANQKCFYPWLVNTIEWVSREIFGN